MAPDIYPEDYGILQGSMLVSDKLFNSGDGPRQMAEAFARLPMGTDDILFTSNLGGRVTTNAGISNTSMHPAWRSSAQLITFVRAVEPSIEGKIAAVEGLTNIQMPILYALEPLSRVSYLNLGAPNERDFQHVYWGDNYDRLARIKRIVDKDDLFITRLGVGSERWDEDGMCRKSRSVVSRAWELLSDIMLS
jgi:hypothetical protein